MAKILLPADGSEVSVRMAQALAKRVAVYAEQPEIHLLNIQPPVKRDVSQFVARHDVQAYHRDEGLAALAEVRASLEAAGLAPIPHVVVDDTPALAIVRFAREKAVDEIVMGSHGRGSMAGLLLGSVAREVVKLADVPVTLIK